MTRGTSCERLESGRSNSFIDEATGQEGLVSVWMHEGRYVLTGEECPPGEQ